MSSSRYRILGLAAAVLLAPGAAAAEEEVASAPASVPSANKVTEIAIEGLRRVEREAALSGIKTKVGEVLSPTRVTEDLRTLWAKGFFRDLTVSYESVEGGKRVIFVVVEKPSIREVKFNGHDDISSEDIKGVVDVKPFTILNVELLKRNVTKIKDLYVEKGYYLAQVSYRVEPVTGSEHQVTILFDIVENAKVMVRQISFVGNESISAETLKSVLQTREGGELSWLTKTGTYKEEFFQTDLFRIQAVYYDHGFVAVKVGDPTATISRDRRYIYLSVPIEEGEKYNIGDIRFSGDVELRHEEDPERVLVDEAKLRRRLSIHTGELFNRTKLFEDIQTATDAYRNYGYAYANVTPNSALRTKKVPQPAGDPEAGEACGGPEADTCPAGFWCMETEQGEKCLRPQTCTFASEEEETETDEEEGSCAKGYACTLVEAQALCMKEERLVDLDLEVERGELVYIERIEIVGNTRTRDKVIRREISIFEGDRYSSALINLSKARIFQLGFFETVELATSRGSEPHLMNVTVEVKEKSTGTFQIGAGFSSVESFIATAQIAQNNFLGNGQLLSVSAQLSFGDFARQLATLQFYEPYFLDSLWSFSLNAYLTQRFYRDFQRIARGIAPTLGYPITHDLRLNAGYTLEWIEISTDFGGSSGPALANLNRDGRNSAVNGSIAYDTRDNRLFPSRGHYHVLSTEVSHEAIGSEEGLGYWRSSLYVRYYYPLPLSFVLKINASFGFVNGFGGDPVPISERFFPGGIYSVRGFEPRGLGPTIRAVQKGDPTSPSSEFTIGGNKEAVFNLELEFPIIEAAGIKGVLFADAGNAYDDDENFFYVGLPDDQKPDAYVMRSNRKIKPWLGLYYSFGFGFRWFSPIGPLRFEWGIPITKRDADDRNLIFEFTIGNFF